MLHLRTVRLRDRSPEEILQIAELFTIIKKSNNHGSYLMPIDSSVDLHQLKRLIGQRTIDEKLELVRVLEKETYPIRFRKLLKRMKINNLTIDDITSETESVRAHRFNARKNH